MVIDIFTSFKLCKNKKNIIKAGQSDGGAGGEFFFSTFDNKLIIKTISSSELQVFKDNLEKYYEHFVKNPNSLIAKILGVYTIKFDIEKRP